MPSKPEINLYEYAIVRYVPSVEREEFINVGLLMMCKRRRYLRMAIHLSEERLAAFSCPHSHDEIAAQLGGFAAVADMSNKRGPMGEFPAEERFRWLTASKSASLQTSRPHPGLCTDLDSTFDRLFAELVL